MTRTCGATQGQTRLCLSVSQSGRGPRIERGHGGQTLGEGLATTRTGGTKEAAHLQSELDGRRGPRQVGECAVVIAMNPAGQLATVGTWSLRRVHRGHQDNAMLVQNEGPKLQVLVRWK